MNDMLLWGMWQLKFLVLPFDIFLGNCNCKFLPCFENWLFIFIKINNINYHENSEHSHKQYVQLKNESIWARILQKSFFYANFSFQREIFWFVWINFRHKYPKKDSDLFFLLSVFETKHKGCNEKWVECHQIKEPSQSHWQNSSIMLEFLCWDKCLNLYVKCWKTWSSLQKVPSDCQKQTKTCR